MIKIKYKYEQILIFIKYFCGLDLLKTNIRRDSIEYLIAESYMKLCQKMQRHEIPHYQVIKLMTCCTYYKHRNNRRFKRVVNANFDNDVMKAYLLSFERYSTDAQYYKKMFYKLVKGNIEAKELAKVLLKGKYA